MGNWEIITSPFFFLRSQQLEVAEQRSFFLLINHGVLALCVCVRVSVPGRCPTVWLCSAAAAPSSKGCSSSGRQTAGTPPRTAACGGAPTLSKQCSWLTTNNTRQTQKQERGRWENKVSTLFIYIYILDDDEGRVFCVNRTTLMRFLCVSLDAET